MAVNHLHSPAYAHQSKHPIQFLRQQLERLSSLSEAIKKQHELLAQQLLDQVRNSLKQPHSNEKNHTITTIQHSLIANIQRQHFLNQVIAQVTIKIEQLLSQPLALSNNQIPPVL